MRGWVGVTDPHWARFLAQRPDINEVNFWQPSGRHRFGSIEIGEPFFFKTKFPQNMVVGGGFFTGYVPLPLSRAWDIFGEANGAASLTEMRRLIEVDRHEPINPGEDPVIGCRFVRDVRFFAEPVDPPPGWAGNIVQGKRFELADPAVSGYFGDLMTLLLGAEIEVDLSVPWHRNGPVFGTPKLAPYRLGQGSFRAVVQAAYHDRCAITGSKIAPVLQAAHIQPVTAGGEHRLDNGLLLRSDVHILFDRGYLGVDPLHRLQVSPRLRADFGNGEQFYSRAGNLITLPDDRRDRPQREFLEWHLDSKFLHA
jgi:putative restriction endonuclease